MVSRVQVDPKEVHVQGVKMIFTYLKGTMEFGLWYPKGMDFMLFSYLDADWIGYVNDRKNVE